MCDRIIEILPVLKIIVLYVFYASIHKRIVDFTNQSQCHLCGFCRSS